MGGDVIMASIMWDEGYVLYIINTLRWDIYIHISMWRIIPSFLNP